MKILTESASSQILKIIPKSYPTLVDVVIVDEEANTAVTIEDVVSVTNGGYLDIDSVYDLKEGKFYSFEVFDKAVSGANIKCIKANNEYLSSPSGSYFPASSDDLDIEIRYKDLLNTSTNTMFVQSDLFQSGVRVNYIPSAKNLTISNGISTLVNYVFTNHPLVGTIKVKGNAGDIELYFDDVLLATSTLTADLTNNNNKELLFNASTSVQPTKHTISDLTFDYIKINDNVWTFTEGTGSTTTNSQSVVTTLNSDVSTEAMWIATYSQNDSIFKGKIFCTNQTNYSINNGQFTEQSKDNKYVIYE